jgi:hypothetical protein
MKLNFLLRPAVLRSSLAVALLGTASVASALPVIAYNFGWNGFGVTYDTGNAGSATLLTWAGTEVVASPPVITGNIGVTAGTALLLSPSTMSLALGTAFTKIFTASGNLFTESLTVSTVTQSSADGIGFLNLIANGTVTCSGPCAFDAAPVPVSFSLTATTNGSATVTGGTDRTSIVSLPATLGLIGLGLSVGLVGVARRRRT